MSVMAPTPEMLERLEWGIKRCAWHGCAGYFHSHSSKSHGYWVTFDCGVAGPTQPTPESAIAEWNRVSVDVEVRV
jgi:hypothetical protein